MSASPNSNADLATLASAFWTWRASTQPSSGDDIPRIARPGGWLPDWSPDAIDARRTQLARFEKAWRTLGKDISGWSVPLQVDYRLVGSALARVHWELDVLQGWRRNPRFYVYQTLGAVFEALLDPAPFDTTRRQTVQARLDRIPETLQAAGANLDDPIRPFAQLAIDALDDIEARLRTVGEALDVNTARAATELAGYADWLRARVDTLPADTAIGRAAYVGFLREVALNPRSPEEIARAGQQELDRALSFEVFERNRHRDLPELPLPATVEEQIEREAAGETMLRNYCEEHNLLSFPAWLGRYRNLPLPKHLVPLRTLAVTDDLRPGADGIAYIPPPAADLPYFYLAMARDPRTLIAHEGVHYYQLSRSWAHPNPIRRQYYDSGPNEGIGFYAEEMLLQAGLFDNSPRSREIIYNFMRLRALRVSVDVRLALGQLTIETGAEELARRVPMDIETARDEAAMFASEPGQAITYQIGKLEILRFLADARAQRGAEFSLRTFHDELFVEGNVPISLQRWQALGLRDEIEELDTAGERLPT